jgi:hypothetical protein
VPQLNVSYKPQKIAPKFPGTVRELLHNKVREAVIHPQFISDVIKPLAIEAIFDNAGARVCMFGGWLVGDWGLEGGAAFVYEEPLGAMMNVPARLASPARPQEARRGC